MITGTYFPSDYILTKEDTASLRKSKTICLDLFEEKGETVSQVRTIRDIPIPGTDKNHHHTYTIPASARLRIHHNRKTPENRIERCYAYITRYDFAPDSIDCIIKMVRPGDQLTIEWISEGGPPKPGKEPQSYINGARTTVPKVAYDAPLYWDMVKIMVYRKGKLAFGATVDTGICPNNTARMIKEI